MFLFIYRKETNDRNGNPRRYVTMWYRHEAANTIIPVCQNINEGYIGMWATVQNGIKRFAENNPDLKIDPANVNVFQLPTGYKGG